MAIASRATRNSATPRSGPTNTPEPVTATPGGLLPATGQACGGTLVSATATTNSDGSGVSSSGAIVTGYMAANLVCYTGGAGGGEPILTITFLGSGTGTVTSSTSGFSCTSVDTSCVDSFPSGTTVTLTATPVAPSTFGGWTGGCTGTSTCVLVLQTDTTVTAEFD